MMAERVGFEPTVRGLPVQRFSSFKSWWSCCILMYIRFSKNLEMTAIYKDGRSFVHDGVVRIPTVRLQFRLQFCLQFRLQISPAWRKELFP
jgi:hypothetical protein